MFSVRSANRRVSFIKSRGMCGEGHQLVILNTDGTCPICINREEKNMANKAEIEIEVNTKIYKIALESKMIIENIQKLLGVYTTTEALSKIAVLMREEDEASKLLSKALGHLETCDCEGGKELRNEIASAFGESGLTQRAPDAAKWSGHYEACPANQGGTCTCGY